VHLCPSQKIRGRTNNDAVRVLCSVVIWRGSSGGTDSEAGGRFVERMLGVTATCLRQNLNVSEVLTAFCRTCLDCRASLPLLPAEAGLAAA